MQKNQILATGELSTSVLRMLAALFFQRTRVAHSFRRSAVFRHLWALHMCPRPRLHERLQNSGQQTHTNPALHKNVRKEYAHVYVLKTLRVLSVGRDLPLLSVKIGWSRRPQCSPRLTWTSILALQFLHHLLEWLTELGNSLSTSLTPNNRSPSRLDGRHTTASAPSLGTLHTPG